MFIIKHKPPDQRHVAIKHESHMECQSDPEDNSNLA